MWMDIPTETLIGLHKQARDEIARREEERAG
jgi:hypothetical protein